MVLTHPKIRPQYHKRNPGTKVLDCENKATMSLKESKHQSIILADATYSPEYFFFPFPTPTLGKKGDHGDEVVRNLPVKAGFLLEWIHQNMVRHFVTHKQVQADKPHPI